MRHVTPLRPCKGNITYFESPTCELSQDLFDRHAAGVGVAMGAVGSDHMIRRVNGGLDACSTRFLQTTEKFVKKLFMYPETSLEADL